MTEFTGQCLRSLQIDNAKCEGQANENQGVQVTCYRLFFLKVIGVPQQQTMPMFLPAPVMPADQQTFYPVHHPGNVLSNQHHQMSPSLPMYHQTQPQPQPQAYSSHPARQDHYQPAVAQNVAVEAKKTTVSVTVSGASDVRVTASVSGTAEESGESWSFSVPECSRDGSTTSSVDVSNQVPSARLTLHSTKLCTKFKMFGKNIFFWY